MKKVLFFCLFLTVMNGYAQKDDPRQFLYFGLKAGLNYSSIYHTTSENFDAKLKVGFAGGAFLSLPLGKYFGLQPEVLLSQRGFSAKGTYINDGYKLKRSLNYIDLPIFFTFKPAERLTILAGPQYSILMSQNDVLSNTTLNRIQQEEFKNARVRHQIICLTAGLDFNCNNIIFGIRTGWDVTNNKARDITELPRYKSIWFQTSIGFRVY